LELTLLAVAKGQLGFSPNHPIVHMNQIDRCALSAGRSLKPRVVAFGAAALLALAGAVQADVISTPIVVETHTEKPKFRHTVDTRPERFGKSLEAVYDDHAPHHPANQITNNAVERVVSRMRELQAKGATAGAESKASKEPVPPEPSLNLSVFAEYNYINSDDKRRLDTDSDSHAASGGFDLTLGQTLVGLIYYYQHQDGTSEFLRSRTRSDSNFISLYAAHPIQPWLSIGLTGGYGHTDVDIRLFQQGNRQATSRGSDSDAWTASPFITFSYAEGNFFSSLTMTYQYLHTDSDDSGKLNFQLVAGYQVCEAFSAEFNGKFSQMLHNSRGGEPEDDNWFGVGAKFKERITPNFGAYQAYQFNVNETFDEHMVVAGLTYSF
jgi:archaellin